MNPETSLFPQKKSAPNDDNLIPLINIVFLLLVFFMVAGQIRAMPNAELTLPSSNLEQQPDATRVLLELNQHNEIRLNGNLIAAADLPASLQSLAMTNSDSAPGSSAALSIALFVDKQITATQLTQLLKPLRQQLKPLRQQSIARIQLHTLIDAGQPALSIQGMAAE